MSKKYLKQAPVDAVNSEKILKSDNSDGEWEFSFIVILLWSTGAIVSTALLHRLITNESSLERV